METLPILAKVTYVVRIIFSMIHSLPLLFDSSYCRMFTTADLVAKFYHKDHQFHDSLLSSFTTAVDSYRRNHILCLSAVVHFRFISYGRVSFMVRSNEQTTRSKIFLSLIFIYLYVSFQLRSSLRFQNTRIAPPSSWSFFTKSLMASFEFG